MPDYSTSNRFELPASGERSGTWGDMMNTFMGTLLEDALSGNTTVTMPSDANYTLTTATAPNQDEARRLILTIASTPALSTTRDIIIPNVRKVYSILNSTSGSQSIRVRTTTSTIMVTIPNGRRRFIYCDATNTFDMMTDLPSGVTANGVQVVTLDASQVLTNKTITAPVITSPTLTVRDDVLTIQDNLDNTKQARFELSPITAGQTRTITVPDASLTLVGADTTQTLTNKTLTSPVLTTPTITVRDNVFTLQDNADATKQALFELSGITAGNTRTITVADGSFVAGGWPVIGTSANYNITAADRGDVITCYAGCSTVTFPNAANVGVNNNFFCKVFNNTGGNVTLTATGPSVFIQAGTGYPASFTLPHLSQCTAISDGANWWVDAPIPWDNTVSTAKIVNAAVTPTKLSQPFTQMTPRSMSGTQQDWTGIPSWANRITIGLANVSLNQNNSIRIQAGSGSVDQTATYVTAVQNGSAWIWGGNSFGWDLTDAGNNTGFYFGIVTLLHMGSNQWVFNTLATNPTLGPTISFGSGYKTLSGALDRIRLTSYNPSGAQGTASFDAGTVTVYYE